MRGLCDTMQTFRDGSRRFGESIRKPIANSSHPSEIGALLIIWFLTDTCNAMAQKIHEWINFEPISFLNVCIHPIEHIEVNHKFFESLFLRARSLKSDRGVNLCRKITGS